MIRKTFIQGALPVSFAVVLFALLSCPALVRAQAPHDAVSAEVSIYNNLSTGVAMDATSYEVSIFRSMKPSIDMSTDAISPEISLHNLSSSLESQVLDAISYEFSVQAVFHCTGDFTGDFAVTTDDIAAFARVLIGTDNHPARRDAADINCDGVPDAKDIQLWWMRFSRHDAPVKRCFIGST